MHCHLGDEVVVEEDIGWSGEHGVGGGVPGSGLQEGVGGEAGPAFRTHSQKYNN